MPECAKQEMIKWTNHGNPSATYPSAREAKKMMDEFRDYIAKSLGVQSCCTDRPDAADTAKRAQTIGEIAPNLYKVIFTSCGSESNCFIIRCTIEAFTLRTHVIPHVIVSAIEHKSIIALVEQLERCGYCTVSRILPKMSGHILAEDVAREIRPNTCLVSIQHANNETGAINDIAAIAAVSHKMRVPFHSDIVQSYGKIPINLVKSGIDTVSISFHKVHGAPGLGALVIKEQFLCGYHLEPLSPGGGEMQWRSGTQAPHNIAAAFAGTVFTFERMESTTRNHYTLKSELVKMLHARIPTRTFEEYMQSRKKYELECVILQDTARPRDYLPNTILMSIAKHVGETACNSLIKQKLEDAGVIVSVSSACLSSHKGASHVLLAMNVPTIISDGVIRVSMGTETTIADIRAFVNGFLAEGIRQLQITKSGKAVRDEKNK
ncbi:MAG: aminotransferase class V-fold PLP-dependent enzyme [Methylomonas sp.]|nr:aminotransferase class V-fold PLP-dependent enzyme [Methylomonas sp.]